MPRRSESARIRRTTREVCGHERLLAGQDEAMAKAVAGRDVLMVSPTGSGKSLVYQVPGILREGPTLLAVDLMERHELLAVQGEGGVAGTPP